MLTLINHSFFFFTVILLIRSFAAIKQEFVNKIKGVQKKKINKNIQSKLCLQSLHIFIPGRGTNCRTEKNSFENTNANVTNSCFPPKKVKFKIHPCA